MVLRPSSRTQPIGIAAGSKPRNSLYGTSVAAERDLPIRRMPNVSRMIVAARQQEPATARMRPKSCNPVFVLEHGSRLGRWHA